MSISIVRADRKRSCYPVGRSRRVRKSALLRGVALQASAKMKAMPLRALLLSACLAAAALAQTPPPATIRGTLLQRPGKPPAVETADHHIISLDGDEPTKGVLNDKRLAGFDLEAKGHFTASDQFLVDPIHTKAMFVHKDGHVKVITYWCDVCSIRTYTPGPCWCCQKETLLDLRDPDQDQ